MGEQPPSPPRETFVDALRSIVSSQERLIRYIAELERRRDIRDQQFLTILQGIASKLGAAIPPLTPLPPITVITPPGLPGLPGLPGVPGAVTIAPAVVVKPEGNLRDYSSITTTGTYATVAKIKPTQGKIFKLTKIIVSCPSDVMFKLQWAGQDITPEIYVLAKLPFTDWFPYGFKTKDGKNLEGDGSAFVTLQAKFPSGGTADTCFAEVSGDEETP